MEIKSIEVLQQEAAEELNYANWTILRKCHNYNLSAYDNIWKTLLHRYESQFQANTDLITTELCVQNERIAELEDALGRVVKDIDETSNPYLEITSETLVLIESIKVNRNESKIK